ncbi:MAG: outer membrane protein transport protein [Leptospirales bacterium]|nr:outer membrane protein transport protein [Leptospirales bacterium]
MKRFTLMLITITALSSTVFAGNGDYMSTQSAKFIMNTASVARTEGADIVAYNPAGTAYLAPGLYFDVSNQMLLRNYQTKVKESPNPDLINKKYEQSEPTYLMPNLYVVNNFGQQGPGKLAAFLQGGIIGGDGTMKWNGTIGSNALIENIIYSELMPNYDTVFDFSPPPQGSPPDSVGSFSSSFETSSVYYAIGIGAAYTFFEDKASLSLGLKYIMAKRTGKINGVINLKAIRSGGIVNGTSPVYFDIADEYEYDANGITPVIGIGAKPMEGLTLGLRFEMETSLKFKYKTKKIKANPVSGLTPLEGNMTTVADSITPYLPDYKGMKAKQNLPSVLSLGGEYVVMPELTVGLAVTMFFAPEVNYIKYEYDPVTKSGTSSVKNTNGFGVGYEIALSGGYKILDELKVGLGLMYTKQGVKDGYLQDYNNLLATSTNPILDSINIGLGATYTIIENLDVTLAFNWELFFGNSLKVQDPDMIDPNTNMPVSVPYKFEYTKNIYGIYIGVGYRY